MPVRIPNNLKEGDKIGICCPSSQVSVDVIEHMQRQLEFWGFEVVIGKTIGTNYHNFSGTDLDRLQDFQRMIKDPEIKAILFGRGGYGMVRIIDHIDFRPLIDQPKWMVGYSDITVLHMHAHRNIGIATLHAHMSGGYHGDQFDNNSIMSIYHALTGRPTHHVIPAKNGANEYCKGELIGGNLRTMCDLIGTPSDVSYDGKILVIEDINEYKHSIDRMMYQLYRSGKLDRLAGLIVGGFTDTKEQTTPFGQSEYELIWDKVGNFNYPVCFGFPVGHQARNYALKMGVEHELIISENQVELKEITSPSV